MSNICQCGQRMLRGWGATHPTILFLTGFGDKTDAKYGTIASNQKVQHFIQTEFTLAGISSVDYRIEALWKHYMDKKVTPDDACYKHLVQLACDQMEQVKYVLLSGPLVASVFLDEAISTVNGLEVTSDLLPKGPTYYGIVSYSYSMAQTMGEFRLALQKLVQRIKDDTRH